MRRIYRRLKIVLSFFLHSGNYIHKDSYYPEEKRKSTLRILVDFVLYIMRYGEIPRFYFVYGLDRVAADTNEYMAYSQFMTLRQKKNTTIVGTQTPYNYVCLLRDKTLFEWISEKYNIPTPRVEGTLLGGVISGNSSHSSFQQYLTSLTDESSLFLKEKSGNKGRGAYSLDKINGKYFLNDMALPIGEILDTIPKDVTYIIQKRLKQHQVMNKLYPHALNTLRIVSVIDHNEVVILGSLLRIGAKGTVVDNWAHGGVAVGVNDNGMLMKWALFKPGYGTKTDRHPDTGIVFEGYQLPFWKEIVSLVKDTHRKLSCIGTIGWDIAITVEGPIVLEGNDDYDGALLQACTGGKKKAFLKYYY